MVAAPFDTPSGMWKGGNLSDSISVTLAVAYRASNEVTGGFHLMQPISIADARSGLPMLQPLTG
jgi:hypothetical protein